MVEKIKYDVNIDLANQTKKEMSEHLKTDQKRVLNKVGAFSSLYDINFPEYKNPVLVLKTEEPGSKQGLAMEYDKIEGVCFDMINHLINDCIVMGAKPLTVQDAIICGKMDSNIVKRCVKAMAEACKNEGCVLTGGETSEQPGILGDNTYILTSSIVGIVDKEKVIDGSKISKGDSVIALASSGIHTNGYTLVRSIMRKYPDILNENIDGVTFIDSILEPHKCYYSTLKDLFETDTITGLAHITGGGIKENLNRILPKNMDAQIDLSKYKVNTIFKVLKKYGNVENSEMLRTFNLGVGLAMVVKKESVQDILAHCINKGVDAFEIGFITEGNQQVNTFGQIQW